MSNTFHKLTIKSVIQETADTVSILFDMPDSLSSLFSFKAGQYLTLKAMINGEDVRRAYSLSSAPHENEWKVAVKKVENGKFSTYAQNLKAGDELEVMAPQGNFTLKSDDVKNYVLYAAGSGITPMISIAKYILKNSDESTVTMFYGNRTIMDTVYKDELDAMAAKHSNFRLRYILSREEGDAGMYQGRIDTAKIEELFNKYLADTRINDVYSCGPEQIIHAVNDFYTQKGLPKENIHFELFTTPVNEVISEEETSGEIPELTSAVTVIIDDEEFEFELNSKGKDILQAAQDADADVPFSCKGGVCCTCKAKVMEGKAVMDLNYALDPEEVEEGFVLTCQSHPVTEKVVISFDEY